MKPVCNEKVLILTAFNGDEYGLLNFLRSVYENRATRRIDVIIVTLMAGRAISIIRPWLKKLFIRVVKKSSKTYLRNILNRAGASTYTSVLLAGKGALYEEKILPAHPLEQNQSSRSHSNEATTIRSCSGTFVLLEYSHIDDQWEGKLVQAFLAAEAFLDNEKNPRDSEFAPIRYKRTNILFVGPKSFPLDTGLKNVKLIYPSLLDPLSDCNIHILCGPSLLPSFAKDLKTRYRVQFHAVDGDSLNDWIRMAIEIGVTQNIDIFTNVFYGFYFGFIACTSASFLQRKAITRFPANEIFVREFQGVYNGTGGSELKQNDLTRERIAVSTADKVIAVSPWDQERLKNLGGDAAKVFWCMRGIDLCLYRPNPERQRRPALNFLFAGRNASIKGIGLVEEVARIFQEIIPDAHFYFAGQFERKSENNRTYLGYLSPDELRAVYDDMDVLLLASVSEGFANVVVEAAACGLACIISEDSHGNFFSDMKNALLFKRTVSGLVECLKKVHDNRELFCRLQFGARRIAESQFGARDWAQKYREILLN